MFAISHRQECYWLVQLLPELSTVLEGRSCKLGEHDETMSNLLLRRWRHEIASNEQVGESVLDWSPSHKCTFPHSCQNVYHSRALYYPAAMQVDRSRLCAASRHALICMFMPPLLQLSAFLYLMEVIDQRQVAYI